MTTLLWTIMLCLSNDIILFVQRPTIPLLHWTDLFAFFCQAGPPQQVDCLAPTWR